MVSKLQKNCLLPTHQQFELKFTKKRLYYHPYHPHSNKRRVVGGQNEYQSAATRTGLIFPFTNSQFSNLKKYADYHWREPKFPKFQTSNRIHYHLKLDVKKSKMSHLIKLLSIKVLAKSKNLCTFKTEKKSVTYQEFEENFAKKASIIILILVQISCTGCVV